MWYRLTGILCTLCRLIRLTAPNLNYMIGTGATLLYIAIIVAVLPAKSVLLAGITCNLEVWLTGFGYSLCYGTILVKMWRVYYIFNNPSSQKKKVTHVGNTIAFCCFKLQVCVYICTYPFYLSIHSSCIFFAQNTFIAPP